jgi:mono/diheme cytochrome c family protein
VTRAWDDLQRSFGPAKRTKACSFNSITPRYWPCAITLRQSQLNLVYALAYANGGFLFESQGQKTRAIEDLLQALTLDPSQVAVRDALKRLGTFDFAQKESDSRIRHGKALAEANCGRCHAIATASESHNRSAPAFQDLRRRYHMRSLRRPITRGIAAPHDQMPQFDCRTMTST